MCNDVNDVNDVLPFKKNVKSLFLGKVRKNRLHALHRILNRR